jgi:hypothetical protein
MSLLVKIIVGVASYAVLIALILRFFHVANPERRLGLGIEEGEQGEGPEQEQDGGNNNVIYSSFQGERWKLE